MSLAESLRRANERLSALNTLAISTVPVHGKTATEIGLVASDGGPNEEFYRWQLIDALIDSGLYARELIGAEVHFPKGSKGATDLELDAAVFDSAEWLGHYLRYCASKSLEDLQWLGEHLVAVVEVKRNEKDISTAFTRQLRPAMREKEPGDAPVLGIFYDSGRLFVFQRKGGKILRLDNSKNAKGDSSGPKDLSLDIPDAYDTLPGLAELRTSVEGSGHELDISSRTLDDLVVIASIHQSRVQDALSSVLRTLDRNGMVNQHGYEILLQTLALKIFDEKTVRSGAAGHLRFYVTREEREGEIGTKAVGGFIDRMSELYAEAVGTYPAILDYRQIIDWKSPNDVRSITAICDTFQHYSFERSIQSDLYQLVFYNFANKFQEIEKAQFLTPLPIIDFIVKIVNPRANDSVFDPCCGIGDFLSLAYVHSREIGRPLSDDALFGTDISENMIALSQINMLLNGDGNANLFALAGLGAVTKKIADSRPPRIVELDPDRHKLGNWDDWPDRTRLRRFDVVLTNPPFGMDRAYRSKDPEIGQALDLYATSKLIGDSGMDPGVLFLENAVRSIRTGGRLGIVVSNSIASVDRWRAVRQWLLGEVRVVALFDLPPDVFADAGANTTIIIAYKPSPQDLEALRSADYSIFVRDIQRVGYRKRIVRRNVVFEKAYRINPTTFESEADESGGPIADEDFSQTVVEFREWATNQERELRELFLS